MLQKSAYFLKLTCSPRSNFLLLAMATLGTFYKVFDKPKEAVLVFQHVVNNIGKITLLFLFFSCFFLQWG